MEYYFAFDFVISAMLVVLMAWYLRICSKRGEFEGFPKWFVPSLIGYHFVLSGISYFYILKFGGDSTAYWNLTADVSQNANGWMEHWGRNTFFIQWLNYVPAKILKLNYLTGCFIYSSLSALGFIWLVILVKPFFLIAVKRSDFFAVIYFCIFFLPGPHFWTGIVGKEALIWFCLLIGIRGVMLERLVIFVISVGILILVRPLVGFIFSGVLAVYLLSNTSISYRHKLGVLIFLAAAGILCLSTLFLIMHIEDWSLESLREFSEGQYQFLENYMPTTLVPMEEYSFSYRLFTVGFRPYLGEIFTFWGFISGLENSILIVLSLGLIPVSYYSFGKSRMFFPLLALFAGIAFYLFSIALSVNVLGIMIRLKSTALPFLAISGWYGWFLLIHHRKDSRII